LREEHRVRDFKNRVLRRIFTKHNQNDQVKEGVMGTACSRKGREEKCI
jgi:hypothetical protein